jgi:hypothetical protein
MYVFVQIPWDWILNEVVSVAIWIRNRLAVATAFGLWGIGVAFFIQSEALLLPRIADNLDFDTSVVS